MLGFVKAHTVESYRIMRTAFAWVPCVGSQGRMKGRRLERGQQEKSIEYSTAGS